MATPVNIGVNLGNARSLFGYMQHKVPKVQPSARGHYSISSVVCWEGSGEFVVGTAIEDYLARPAWTVVSDVKRLLVCADAEKICEWQRFWPFEVGDVNGRRTVTLAFGERERQFTPRELALAIIADVVRRVSEAGLAVRGAAISLPSCFPEDCCSGLRDAIQAAHPDWQAVSIIRDLEAAALAYASDRPPGRPAKSHRLLIVDFGDGSTDVGIVDIGDPESPAIVSVAGDPMLGGRDLDIELTNRLLTKFLKQGLTSLTPQNGRRVGSILLERCRAAKETLSSERSTEINLRFPRYAVDAGEIPIKREDLEQLGEPIFCRVLDLVRRVLEESRQNPKELDDVLLIGSSCKIPSLRARILSFVGWSNPIQENDLLVAQGAILSAGRHSVSLSPPPAAQPPLKPQRESEAEALSGPTSEPPLSSPAEFLGSRDSSDCRDGRPEIDRLRARIAELETENARIRESRAAPPTAGCWSSYLRGPHGCPAGLLAYLARRNQLRVQTIHPSMPADLARIVAAWVFPPTGIKVTGHGGFSILFPEMLQVFVFEISLQCTTTHPGKIEITAGPHCIKTGKPVYSPLIRVTCSKQKPYVTIRQRFVTDFVVGIFFSNKTDRAVAIVTEFEVYGFVAEQIC
jgi:actin-like ATPase involved in cell morphogenesis